MRKDSPSTATTNNLRWSSGQDPTSTQSCCTSSTMGYPKTWLTHFKSTARLSFQIVKLRSKELVNSWVMARNFLLISTPQIRSKWEMTIMTLMRGRATLLTSSISWSSIRKRVHMRFSEWHCVTCTPLRALGRRPSGTFERLVGTRVSIGITCLGGQTSDVDQEFFHLSATTLITQCLSHTPTMITSGLHVTQWRMKSATCSPCTTARTTSVSWMATIAYKNKLSGKITLCARSAWRNWSWISDLTRRNVSRTCYKLRLNLSSRKKYNNTKNCSVASTERMTRLNLY